MNNCPTTAHRTPAATPPISAGFHFTRVFGTNMYTAVKIAVTMKKGATSMDQVVSRSQKGM